MKLHTISIGDNLGTICMKCPILFPGKIKKNISKCYLLKIKAK